jgi:hypothetical protein
MRDYSATTAVFVVTTVSISLWPNVLVTFVDQVKRLLALNYGRFETIRHKTRSRSIRESFSEERMVIAPRVGNPVSNRQKKNSLFS